MQVNELITAIKGGKVLLITTYLKQIKVDNKCLNRWEKAGIDLLKDGKENETGFYIASGKKYNYVIPEGCSIKLI
jgi:hypothetical protein